MDERLRALELRWLETKATEDEAAWIAESVRAGVLDEAHVRLAARLGHPGAAAFGKPEFRFDYQTDWEDWAGRVIAAAEEAELDPRVVVARLALPGVETYFRGVLGVAPSETVRGMYRALLRFVSRPNVVTAAKLPAFLDRYYDESIAAIPEEDQQALAEVGELNLYGDEVFEFYRLVIGEDLRHDAQCYVWEVDKVELGVRELVTWLLGRGDPVSARLTTPP